MYKGGTECIRYFLDLAANAAENMREKSAKLPSAARIYRQPGRQAERQEDPVTALPPQPTLTSEKTEKFINSIYSNKLIYAQGTDQPAQLS